MRTPSAPDLRYEPLLQKPQFLSARMNAGGNVEGHKCGHIFGRGVAAMAPVFLLISADEQPCTELVGLVAQTAYTRTKKVFFLPSLFSRLTEENPCKGVWVEEEWTRPALLPLRWAN